MGLDYKKLASCIAEASKDPRHKVGAIVVDANGNVRSTGYNGAPRGVFDAAWRYEKPAKQFYISHAEENAIAQAARIGVPTDNCTMVIWGKTPCANCSRMIIQAGIKKVIFQKEDITESKYFESFKAAFCMLQEAGIDIQFFNGK